MKILEKLLDLLFPPRCPFCRSILRDGERTVCAACDKSLPRTNAASCEQSFPHVEKCFSPLYYDGTVRQSLLRYKFGGMSVYSEKYSEFILKCIDENKVSCDIITWVPLSAARRRRRGYDQAELLARCLAKRRGIDCKRLIVKIRNNPAQSGTASADMRKKNVSGVYRVVDGAEIRGRTVLLVDDIVTTGSTLGECARVLKSAGAAQVFAATLARNRR